MIKKLFKVVIPIFLSILCGSICGKLVFSSYDKEITPNLVKKKIYLIETGAYSDYDNMVSNTLLSNYIYYQDDGKYNSIIGVTLDEDNVYKIKKTYNGEVIITEYYSTNKELNQQINNFDNLLKETNNSDEVKKIVLETLKLYKNNDYHILG